MWKLGLWVSALHGGLSGVIIQGLMDSFNSLLRILNARYQVYIASNENKAFFIYMKKIQIMRESLLSKDKMRNAKLYNFEKI